MTNAMDRTEWAGIHYDGDHASVVADGEREDEFGYRVADCPLCTESDEEAIVRDLVAYGDKVGRTGVDLICDMDGANDDDVTNGARRIVELHTGFPLTDSIIGDLLEFTSDDDDMFND